MSPPVKGFAHPGGMTPRPLDFSSRLDREWSGIRRSRRALAHAARWRRRLPPGPLVAALENLTDLAQLLDATHGPTDLANDTLLQLVEVGQVDELAGRIVVQRLLPGVIARSRPHRYGCDGLDPVEVAIPAAWFAIRGYDCGRRRRHVASSLLSDTVYLAFKRPARRRAVVTRSTSVHRFDEVPAEQHAHPIVELRDVLCDARRAGIAEADLALLTDLARSPSPRDVARTADVTVRTIRNRRARAVKRIRAAVAA